MKKAVILAGLFGIAFWVLMALMIKAYGAEPSTANDVLVEKRNTYQAQMQKLDAQWQLIPYQYRELEEKVKVIDAELAKRKGETEPVKKNP